MYSFIETSSMIGINILYPETRFLIFLEYLSPVIYSHKKNKSETTQKFYLPS